MIIVALSKQYRLKKDREFKSVFKNGKAFEANFLFIRIKPNGLKVSRFGIAAPSKIFKKAAARNAVKRTVTEALMADMDRIMPGYDVVVGFRKPPVEGSLIKNELLGILKKTKLI